MTNFLRKHIGTIIATIGFFLLCIMTFGDIGDIMAEEYWYNVGKNITSIGFTSIGLTLILVSIKQGLAEQALQKGLNTEVTTRKYKEHKDIISKNSGKLIYLPYFLQVYNKRHTDLRRKDFLIDNGFYSEKALYQSGNTKMIRKYEKIQVRITSANIKWCTVELKYDKNGRILTLNEHRMIRLINGIITSFISMIGITFITGGLFFSPSTIPLWQKFIKLLSYIFSIAISSIFTVIKEYERGAFGVPNELDEINQIWNEFNVWQVPKWVEEEIDCFNKGVKGYEREENTIDTRTDIQEKPVESKDV